VTRVVVTPRGVYPEVAIDGRGRLTSTRGALTWFGDEFTSGLEHWAIAADTVGQALAARARVPRPWLARLVARIAGERVRHRGQRRLRFEAAAATVLLDVFEATARRDRALATDVLTLYGDLLHRTTSHRLRASMVANLERVRRLLDDAGRVLLASGRQRVTPTSPPYRAWFADGRREVHLVCQVQDEFFVSWQGVARAPGVPAPAPPRRPPPALRAHRRRRRRDHDLPPRLPDQGRGHLRGDGTIPRSTA
jgi:hypothetical protein